MPLSEHEQRILEEIEKRLAEEDPRLVQSVARSSLSAHVLRRIRWGIVAFLLGFVLLMMFAINQWIAFLGFAVMLVSALLVYSYLKRMGRDHIRSMQAGGRLSITPGLARLAERFRRTPAAG